MGEQSRENSSDLNKTKSTDLKKEDADESSNLDSLDTYKQFISEKNELFGKQTKDLADQMSKLESQLMSKLSGLEHQLEEKQNEEKELREMMEKYGIKDSEDAVFESTLGER